MSGRKTALIMVVLAAALAAAAAMGHAVFAEAPAVPSTDAAALEAGANGDAEEMSDEQRAEETAEAAISFWRTAWEKVRPFFRLVGIAVKAVAIAIWDAVAGMITIEPVEPETPDAPAPEDGAAQPSAFAVPAFAA